MRTPALLLFFLFVAITAHAQPTVLDDFESIAAWSAHPSDGVSLDLSQDAGLQGRAMRLDFDFHSHGGYAIARRAVNLELPPNYEFTFWMHSDAPVNNLELKLIDESGENVWWMNRRDFVYPREWTEIATKKRQISFAWGPAGGGEAHHVAAIEIVVTAGTGGKGRVWIDDLALAGLPPPVTGAVKHGAWRVPDGMQQLTIDLALRREIGGLHIKWDASDFARDFSVELSKDGTDFKPVRDVVSNGRVDELIYLPDQDARAVRLSMRKSSRGRGYAIESVEVEPVDWADSPNAFFSMVAKSEARGNYPRYLAGEQPYWTVIGADRAEEEVLVGEDGNVEPFKGGFSLEPFLLIDGEVVRWSDVESSQSLAEGDLPIPFVQWTTKGVTLTMTAAVTRDSTLLLRYRVQRTTSANVSLIVAVRPFQVNPSTQFLNTTGGVSPIREIAFDGESVVVNGNQRVAVVTKPQRAIAATYDEGEIVSIATGSGDRVRAGNDTKKFSVTDPFGYASCALEYPVSSEESEVGLAVPLESTSKIPADFKSAFAAIADEWREKLHRVAIDIPGAPQVADTIRTSLAYTLIEADGPALEPGSRSYDRAWIRDGSLISATLLRLGHADEAKQFAEWFAGYQYPNGKVPCCVDRRGADPVPENDSHGELIYLVAEIWRTTHDRDFVKRLWPHVDSAVRYIDELRAANHGEFEGLLTESISHEGYSAKPMHSYWDDFFGVRGLDDAAILAGVLGLDARKRQIETEAAQFRHDVAASMVRTIGSHHIDYVPGSAELGDFDATSTAIGISPLNLASMLPQKELQRTFEIYFENLTKRRADYTPYEMRIIGAMIRMGNRDRAIGLIDRFLRDRRPAAWNEWAEVVGTTYREPRFIGDMPHAWIASDFTRSILDAFAYDDVDGTLVIGAGVPRSWLGKSELHVGPLPTYHGAIDIRVRSSGHRIVVDLTGEAKPPRIILRSPDDRPIKRATIDGTAAEHTASAVLVSRLPARIVFEY